uniref:L1 transposable element RRM domain-containing protein n=1 Tax=Latimeria chalumnae TaxID=7897 RepID=H2ZT69_LATCH
SRRKRHCDQVNISYKIKTEQGSENEDSLLDKKLKKISLNIRQMHFPISSNMIYHSNNLSRNRVQLTANVSEVKLAIPNLQNLQDQLGARIAEVEQHVSKIEGDGVGESQRLWHLEQRLAAAAKWIDNLENRSRKNNVRIIGFPEGVEEGNPMNFLQKVLPGLLDLEGKILEMERAHWALGPHPAPGQSTRALIVKLLRYPTRDLLLQAAKLKGQVMWREHRISIFPDWSRELQLKRQWFWDIRKILREKKIKYGLFYPAILKITVNGEALAFTNPEDARKFLAR